MWWNVATWLKAPSFNPVDCSIQRPPLPVLCADSLRRLSQTTATNLSGRSTSVTRALSQRDLPWPGSKYRSRRHRRIHRGRTKSYSTAGQVVFCSSEVQMQTLLPIWGLLLVDVGIQLFGWAAAVVFKTEKFYDLLGSVAYITVATLSFALNATRSARDCVLYGFAAIWALRLGGFLVYRVLMVSGDKRFDKYLDKPASYLVVWMLQVEFEPLVQVSERVIPWSLQELPYLPTEIVCAQAVWVWVTLLPIMLVNINGSAGLIWADFVGWPLWGLGFAVEVVADFQKLFFKQDPNNKGKFINTGLWSISRHPNYAGEITLWWGVWLSTYGALPVWQFVVGLCSPLLVTLLLTKVSGIPILEKSADERWGEDPAYQAYKRNTFVLFPHPFRGKYTSVDSQ